MRTFLGFIAVAVFGAFSGLAADQTWNGKIGDSMCGSDHSKMAAEHGGANAKTSDHDCTLACVKGGGKYVFVSEGKVYPISNQDFAQLEQHAGHTVTLTGDMQEGSINVSKIVMSGE